MIGVFGWLDADPPVGVVLAWTVAIGAVVVLGAALGGRRLVLALVAITAASVVVPSVIQASQMEEHGILFQGRYILPLGVGVVLLAAQAVDEAGDELVDRLSRVVVIVLALTVVGNLVAIWFVARRFAVGTAGPVLFVGDGWTPGISLACRSPWPSWPRRPSPGGAGAPRARRRRRRCRATRAAHPVPRPRPTTPPSGPTGPAVTTTGRRSPPARRRSGPDPSRRTDRD